MHHEFKCESCDLQARRQVEFGEECVKQLGYEPRKLQWKWRQNPPLMPPEPRNIRDDESYNEFYSDPEYCKQSAAMSAWYHECMMAIIDALTHEGIPAWPGDAVGCVEQIIGAFARRERDLLQQVADLNKRIAELENGSS